MRDEFALGLLTVFLHFLVSRHLPPNKVRPHRARHAVEGSHRPASGGECADLGGTRGLDVAPSLPMDPTFLEGNVLPILGRYTLCRSRPIPCKTIRPQSQSHGTSLSCKPVRLRLHRECILRKEPDASKPFCAGRHPRQRPLL